MPMLEETGHMPTEKYAHAPEILAHCQNIGRQYGLYEEALFHTEVTDLRWLEEEQVWQIQTQRGDCFTSQFVGLGTGPLHVPKLPGIPGLADFKGHAFHTSRWDYDYTGGDPKGAALTKLQDKRVAIIGTGATSVQCVPHLAKHCESLYVFQRTPSSVDIRNNQPTDPDWFKTIATPGWQQRWLENFTANQTGGLAEEDLVMDGWTDLSRRIRDRIQSLPEAARTPANMMAAWEESDFQKMNDIRRRVDDVVHDATTADALKAWYRQLCKRPCFHDDYLEAFNQPGTQLIDTDGQGVEQITEKGLICGGIEYEVDCIIYASGFEVGTEYQRRSGFDLTGRAGQALSDYWRDGMRTKHGTHVHGFPNAFIVQPTQGANLISNVPHNLTESGRTIAAIVRHAIDHHAQEVEVTQEAEQAWLSLLLQGPGRMIGAQDCTPGYYNNEGQTPSPGAKYNVGYPHGATAYFEYLKGWRSSGEFEGLTFTPKQSESS
jgi:cyclohexanone monooxygenase